MDTVDISMGTETITLECGKTERDKATANLLTKMVRSMKECGRIVNLLGLDFILMNNLIFLIELV